MRRRALAPLVALVLIVSAVFGLASSAYGAGPVDGSSCSSWVPGRDISNNNGPNVSADAAKADGLQFEYIKATEGTYFHDQDQGVNEARATVAGLLWGDYDFARPTGSVAEADQEAAYFLAHVGNGGPLPSVLDLEATRLSPADTAAWAARWLNDVSTAQHRYAMVYVGGYFAVTYNPALAFYANWLPAYAAHPVSSACAAPMPRTAGANWSTWAVWQFTSTGSLPGIGAGDLDAATPSWFAAVAGIGWAPARPPAAPSAPPTPAGPVYRIGSIGPKVTQIQLLLQDAHISCFGQPILGDGSYGPLTACGVKQWEAKLHLAQDGLWGPMVEDATDRLLALLAHLPQAPPASSLIPPPTLRLGSHGYGVALLQADLDRAGAHLAADGSYGRATALAVANLERVFRLAPDGVYGPQARAALTIAG